MRALCLGVPNPPKIKPKSRRQKDLKEIYEKEKINTSGLLHAHLTAIEFPRHFLFLRQHFLLHFSLATHSIMGFNENSE